MCESDIKKMLASVDVAIDGPRPWDIQVHNDKLYGRVLRFANLGPVSYTHLDVYKRQEQKQDWV